MKQITTNFIGSISATFFDQLSISFVQFFIGITFIYKSVPEEYGLFSFLIALYYLIASIQNALIGTPLMVLIPRLPMPRARKLLRGFTGLLFVGIFILMISFFLSYFLFPAYFEKKSLHFSKVICFLFGLSSLILRDFLRSVEFSKLRPMTTLKRDLTYTFLVIAMIIFMVSFSKIDSYNIFILIGVSSLSVSILPSVNICRPFPKLDEMYFALKKSWNLSTWSVVGAISSWFQMQAVVYLPFFLIGLKEVAYLSASRLIMMPPTLLQGSLGNYLKPLASKKMNKGDLSGIFRLYSLCTLALLVVLSLYTGIALLLLDQLPPSWIPDNYKNISGYIVLWAVIIFFITIRSTMSHFYHASLAFKQLAIRGAVSAIFTIIATWCFILKLGIDGTLVGRMAGELFLMILLTINMHEIAKHQAINIEKASCQS